MPPLGRTLILIGAALMALGVVLQLAPHIPLVGKLPGDIRIEREGYSLYFPVTTCVVLSVLVTLVLQLIARWK